MAVNIAPRVAIIGAGLVGCATALQLASQGGGVSVFDEGAPGAGTSYGNAGAIVTGAVTPSATPGVLRSMPGYIFDRKSPAVLRLHHALRVMPWLFRFVKAGRLAEVERIAAALAPLVRDSMNAHHRLAAKAGSAGFIGSEGWLKIYGSDEAYAATALDRRLMSEAGVPYEVLTPAELRELEPQIAPQAMRHGIFQRQSGFVRDPRGMATAWMEAAQRLGASHERRRVTAVQPVEGGVRLTTEAGTQRFDKLILCAGAWSARIAASWGEAISLESERGYHLAFSEAASGLLRGPVVFPSLGFVLSPMAGGLRLVSGDELAGLEARPNYARIRRLIPDAHSVLPGLAGEEVQREWMGHRPSTPDSLPVIGRSAKHPRIFHAFGHGHIGLTLSAITAELVCEAVLDRTPSIKLDAFSSARFA